MYKIYLQAILPIVTHLMVSIVSPSTSVYVRTYLGPPYCPLPLPYCKAHTSASLWCGHTSAGSFAAIGQGSHLVVVQLKPLPQWRPAQRWVSPWLPLSPAADGSTACSATSVLLSNAEPGMLWCVCGVCVVCVWCGVWCVECVVCVC